MVVFNELYITDDKGSLVIDCQVKDLEIYDNMYIKSIYLDYYKNSVTVGVPSSKALLVYNNTGDDTTVRSIRECVDTLDLASVSGIGVSDFDKGLFYVIVTCDGTLDPSAAELCCGADNAVDIGVALDWKMLFEKGMQYVAYLNANCHDACKDVSAFGSFVMLWNALKLAIASCDYPQLIWTWEKIVSFYTNNSGISGVSGCGCGR